MNKRQVTTLWVIAIALGTAVTAVKLSQKQAIINSTERTRGQLLFDAFPANATSTIEIQGADSSVSLAKKDGKWNVTQRDNYPANLTYVNDFIRTLSELKVTLGMQAGPSFAPRFGMDETATQAAARGLTATFKDAEGKEIAKVSLGKPIDSAAAPSPMGGSSAVGRYVRNHADSSGFYAVSEMFPAVSAEAKRWLEAGFINPEKIQTITLSQTGKTDPAWKLTRETEEAAFKLEGASATEVLDTAAAEPLKNLLAYARFDDVVPATKVAEHSLTEGKRSATIETFEGFTYHLNITPTRPNPKPVAPDTEPAATDNFLITVDLTATLPKERKKEATEKPEDTKTKDAAFAERLKTLSDKLAKEKAFAGITFEVAKSTLDPLLKDREALIVKATPAAVSDGVQKMPGGLITPPQATPPTIEAVTPPISIPSQTQAPQKSKTK